MLQHPTSLDSNMVDSFSSLCFFLSPSLPTEEKDGLSKLIHQFGGSISSERDSEDVTHTISVDMLDASKHYLRFLENNQETMIERPDVFIVTPQFVHKSIENGKKVAEDAFLLCYPFVFYNMVFACSNRIENIAPVAFMVRFLGGIFVHERLGNYETMLDKVTHIITSSDDTTSDIDEYPRVDRNALFLSLEWLKACFVTRSYVNEQEYIVGKLRNIYTCMFMSKNVFKGLSFIIINYPPDFTSSLQRTICKSGGRIHHSKTVTDDEEVNYLITRYACDESYFIKNIEFITTAQWVDDCIGKCKIIPINEKCIYRPLQSNGTIKGFEGKRVTITGISGIERSDLVYLIKQTGALYTGELLKNNDYLIVNSNDVSSKKIEKAHEWGVTIVRKEFIEDSINHWKKLDEAPYIVENKKRKSKQHMQGKDSKKTKTQKIFKISVDPAHEKTYIDIIEKLGGMVLISTFDTSDTHLVTAELKRTQKFLTACAKGNWVLKLSYL